MRALPGEVIASPRLIRTFFWRKRGKILFAVYAATDEIYQVTDNVSHLARNERDPVNLRLFSLSSFFSRFSAFFSRRNKANWLSTAIYRRRGNILSGGFFYERSKAIRGKCLVQGENTD
jgi:hypothetical protein